MSASTTTAGKSRAKLYTIVGVILGIAALALILWNHGLFDKKEDVATIGSHSISEAEYNYYYNRILRTTENTARYYEEQLAGTGLSFGYSLDKSPAEQWENEAEGITYEDFFRTNALNSLQRALILEDHANENGYTLSEAGQQQVQSVLDAQHDQFIQYRAIRQFSESTVIELTHGEGVTKSMMKQLTTRGILADEYAQHISDSFTYTDEEFDAYYNGETDEGVPNKDNLDSFSYYSTYIPAQLDTQLDDAGEPIAATTEETEAALADAEEKANAMSKRLESGEDFDTVAKDFAPEPDEDAEETEALETLTEGLVGSSLTTSTPYAEWLKDAERTADDVTIVANGTSGYYVIQFVSRERDEKSIEYVNTRLIYIEAEKTLVSPEADDTATEETTEVVINASAGEEAAEDIYLPTEEQSAATKTKADEVLAQWEAGEKTVDSFSALAKEHSADKASAELGGVYEKVSRNTFDEAFDAWAFGENPQLGQPQIFESKDADGNILGYLVVYLEELGPVRWVHVAQEALRTDSYGDWYEALLAEYPITRNETFFPEVPAPVAEPEETHQDNTVVEDEPEVIVDDAEEATDDATTPDEEEITEDEEDTEEEEITDEEVDDEPLPTS